MPRTPVVRARGSAFAIVWLTVITVMLGALACAALRPRPTSYIEWTRIADAPASWPGRHGGGHTHGQREATPVDRTPNAATGAGDDGSVLARFQPFDLSPRLAEVLALEPSPPPVPLQWSLRPTAPMLP